MSVHCSVLQRKPPVSVVVGMLDICLFTSIFAYHRIFLSISLFNYSGGIKSETLDSR